MQIKAKEEQHLQELTESKEIDDFDVLFEDHSSAFYLASQMMSDGIILPEYTRQVIIEFILWFCKLFICSLSLNTKFFVYMIKKSKYDYKIIVIINIETF